MHNIKVCPLSNFMCIPCGVGFEPDDSRDSTRVLSNICAHLNRKHNTSLSLAQKEALGDLLKSSLDAICRYHASLVVAEDRDHERILLQSFVHLDSAGEACYYCTGCARTWKRTPVNHTCASMDSEIMRVRGIPPIGSKTGYTGRRVIKAQSVTNQLNEEIQITENFNFGRIYSRRLGHFVSELENESLEERIDHRRRNSVLARNYVNSLEDSPQLPRDVTQSPSTVASIEYAESPKPLLDAHLNDDPLFDSLCDDMMRKTEPDPTVMRMYEVESQKAVKSASGNQRLNDFFFQAGFESLAKSKFGGSVVKMGQYLATTVAGAPNQDDEEEMAVIEVATQMLIECYDGITEIDDFKRAEVSRVGDIDQRGTLQQLALHIESFQSVIQKVSEESPDAPDVHSQEVQDLIAGLQKFGSSHLPSTASTRSVGKLAPDTIKRYNSVTARYVLFLWRFMIEKYSESGFSVSDQDSDEASDSSSVEVSWFAGVRKQMIEYARGDKSDQIACRSAKCNLLKILVRSLRLNEPADTFRVSKFDTLAKIFALGTAIDLDYIEEEEGFNIPMIRTKSPASLHGTTSALLSGFRVVSLRVMRMLESKGTCDDLDDLRRRVHGPSVLVQCPAVKDLAHLAAVAKAFEKDLSPNKASSFQASKSSEDLPYCDTFTQGHGPSKVKVTFGDVGNMVLSVTAAAKKRICEFLHEVVRGLPSSLHSQYGPIDLTNQYQTEAMISAILMSIPKMIPAGEHSNLVVNWPLNNTHDREGEAVPGHFVTASTFSAVYNVPLTSDTGDIQYVPLLSSVIAQLIFDRCKDSPELMKELDKLSNFLVSAVGTIHQGCFRGEPRKQEHFRLRCGITNAFTSRESGSDIHPIADGDSSLLLIHTRVNKFSGSDSYGRRTPYMSVPHDQLIILAFLIPCLRHAQVMILLHLSPPEMNLGKFMRIVDRSNTSQDLMSAAVFMTTRLFVRVELAVTKPLVHLLEDFTNQVERFLNSHLGLPPKSFSLSRFRTLSAVMSMEFIKYSNSLFPSSVSDREVARAFNHSLATHKRHYLPSISTGSPISEHDLDEDLKLDRAFQGLLGIEGIQSVLNRTYKTMTGVPRDPFKLHDHQRLRLLSNNEAHGLVILGYGVNAEMKSPHQARLLTQAISSVQDSLHVLPCGFGKSIAVFAVPLYSFVSSVACLDSETRTARVSSRFQIPILEAETLLSHPSVVKLFAFSRNDTVAPLPRASVTVVIEPAVALTDAMAAGMNEVNGIKAIRWEGSNHARVMEFIDSVKIAHTTGSTREPFALDFDVIVVTAEFFASNREANQAIQSLAEEGIVTLILDEAHTYILHAAYQRSILAIRQLPRSVTPLIAMTGTLQWSLIEELAKVLNANFGYGPLEAIVGSTPERMIVNEQLSLVPDDEESGSDDENDRSRDPLSEYEKRKRMALMWRSFYGIDRSDRVIPPHNRLCVVNVPSEDCGYCAMAAKMTLQALSGFSWVNPQSQEQINIRGKRIQVICGQRSHVKEIVFWIQKLGPTLVENWKDNYACSLVGSDEPRNVQIFNNEWVNATVNDDHYAHIAVTTTVGALGLNAKGCDFVISFLACYGVQMLVQALSRAGRRGENSECLVLHSPRELGNQVQRQSAEEYMLPYSQAGVNMNDPNVIHALSVKSMLPLLNGDATGFENCDPPVDPCRRSILEASINCHGSLRDVIDNDRCCDLCYPSLGEAMKSLMISSIVPNGILAQAREAANPDAAEDIDLDAAEEIGAARAEEHNSTQIRINNALANLQVFLWETLGHNLCYWHMHREHNEGVDPDAIFNSRGCNCKREFYELLRLNHTVNRCYKCFDVYPHTGQCPLPRRHINGIPDDYCTRCGIANATDTRGYHSQSSCSKDKHWGLVIWALRSENGYDQVRSEYEDLPALTDIGADAFPPRVPFAEEANDLTADDLADLGRAAIQWLAQPINNRCFWMAVQTAAISVLLD